jgi:hypothetical protein
MTKQKQKPLNESNNKLQVDAVFSPAPNAMLPPVAFAPMPAPAETIETRKEYVIAEAILARWPHFTINKIRVDALAQDFAEVSLEHAMQAVAWCAKNLEHGNPPCTPELFKALRALKVIEPLTVGRPDLRPVTKIEPPATTTERKIEIVTEAYSQEIEVINNLGTCRSCGAAIRWVDTSKGKKMPVNAEPIPIDQIEPDDLVVDSIGRVTKGKLANRLSDPFFRSHFATCPDANQWRK